jgi:NAD(P)-dependent dehydrogenase (short-subunit alcohol dehydrogenase family)
VDLNLGSAQATAQEILEINGLALAVKADVGNVDQFNSFVARDVETWGRIDVSVNNAGINLLGVSHEVSDATINKTLDVNVKGPMFASRAADML